MKQPFWIPCFAALTMALVSVLPLSAATLTWTDGAGDLLWSTTSTNVGLPLTNWTVLGAPEENPPGTSQFTDLKATNNATQFDRVRSQ